MDIAEFLSPERLQGMIPFALNFVKAVFVLVVGLWIAKKVKQLIIKMGQKSPQLDDTLFKFLGSIARYIIMAFVFIAVLGFSASRRHLSLPCSVPRLWLWVWPCKAPCRIWRQALC